MKNRIWSILTLALILLGLIVVPAQAQSGDLTLYVKKTMGYNNGSEIRGSFSLRVEGPQAIQSVTYQIDGQPMQTVTAAPFELKIATTDYTEGWHDLSASAILADGSTVQSAPKRYHFVSAAVESVGMRNILFPVLGLVGGVMVLMVLFQVVQAKGKPQVAPAPGTERNYGFLGGAICPKCKRPTPVHWAGINLSFGRKYDRCENCGKWSVLKIVGLKELRAAEAAEIRLAQAAPQVSEASQEENLRKELDDSKYTDTM